MTLYLLQVWTSSALLWTTSIRVLVYLCRLMRGCHEHFSRIRGTCSIYQSIDRLKTVKIIFNEILLRGLDLWVTFTSGRLHYKSSSWCTVIFIFYFQLWIIYYILMFILIVLSYISLKMSIDEQYSYLCDSSYSLQFTYLYW